MRLIKTGVIQWGPKQCTCSHCQAVWEVTMDDLVFWEQEAGVQWDTYQETVAGFICQECHQKTRLSNVSALLITQIKRQRSQEYNRATTYYEDH